METLQAFQWPGNVRQLVNATRRLTVTAPGSVISAQDIPGDLGGSESHNAARKSGRACWQRGRSASYNSEEPLLDKALPEFEKTLIEIAMARTNGHRQEAAKLLGWGRNTLARKMKALHLD